MNWRQVNKKFEDWNHELAAEITAQIKAAQPNFLGEIRSGLERGMLIKTNKGEYLIGDGDESNSMPGCGCCSGAVIDDDELVIAYVPTVLEVRT